MALTPEQVVEKRFQATKFREGYDQDEVDDFLDEVVNELRRVNAENDDLRSKLSACERRVGELTRSAATGSTAVVADEREDDVADRPAEREQPTEPPESADEHVQPAPLVTSAASEPAAAAVQATEMLALAQRLHDEHVHTGEQRRDQLISEAEAQAERLVSEAERTHRETLGSLERERSELDTQIDALRAFERDYRARLKNYLESQLRDLDAEPLIVPSQDSQPTQDSRLSQDSRPSQDSQSGQDGDGFAVGTPADR